MRQITFILLFAFASHFVKAAMTLHIAAVPQLTPLWDTLYAAGNFNNWEENDPDFMFIPDGSGWSVTISGSENMALEFKITRGSWSSVEGDALGNYIGNRTAVLSNNTTLSISVAGWEDLSGNSTITNNVRILDSNFLIPQLNRQRKIWLRLPEGYQENGDGYPVVYVMDGQNTMDLATSFSGEWEIDEALESFESEACRNAIVVAIDNGGSLRIDEYSPWVNSQYNEGGEGDAFATFLAETLKPAIDEHFNTLPAAEQTTIVGSSLGALMATYAMCKYPNAFGNGGMFSPAYWFNTEIFGYAINHPLPASARVYFVSGTNESNDMVNDMQDMQNTLINVDSANPETLLLTHTDGAHSEWYWRREFPAAYAWLTQCSSTSTADIAQPIVRVFPNPFVDSLTIMPISNEAMDVKIIDVRGRECLVKRIKGENRLDLSSLSEGLYTLVLTATTGEIIHQENIIKNE